MSDVGAQGELFAEAAAADVTVVNDRWYPSDQYRR
jgi:hypothetical protein